MTTYQSILRQFKKQGLNEESTVTRAEVKRILDSISAKNAGVYEFNGEVANEVWEEAQNQNSGLPIKVRDYIVTLVQAESILREQINKVQSDIRMESDQKKKQQLMNDLLSYTQDHRTITSPFGLQQIRQSNQIRQSKNFGVSPSHSAIFSTEVDQREESTDLKVAFIFCCVLFFLDLILMFHKNHFYTILLTLFVFAAFFLNYFDKNYVKALLISFVVGVVLDLVWLILLAGQYWNPDPETQHSTLNKGFLQFTVFMVVIEMLLKLVIGGLLLKYRDIKDHVKKKLTMCGRTYILQGRKNPNNLLSAILPESSEN